MNDSAKICAVILTYNRKDILKDCLQAVSAQTRRCDQILVVDNASTDGTVEMLAQEWEGRLDVYSLPKNIGAAGGFNFGMRKAYQCDTDFIWVMDDDVIPDADALERLLRANDVLQAQGLSAPFVVSVARSPSGALTNVPTVDARHNELAYENWPVLLEHKMVPVKRATFVSILLPQSTLQRHGLPIASMFIWGEDTEYTLRVTAESPGYLVGDSKVVHTRQLDGMIDIKKEKNQLRLIYFFHFFRNRLYTVKRHAGRRAAIAYAVQLIPLVFGLCTSMEFMKARIVLSAILIGWGYDPIVEAADAPFDSTGIQFISARL